MQSEPTNTPQNTLSVESSQINNQPSHHGLDSSHELSSRPLHPGAVGRRTSCFTEQADAASLPVASHGETFERPMRRLNSSSPRTPSPVDRIIEHENAREYSPKRRHEVPGFTVIKGGKRLGSGQVALSDFPNGQLHYLPVLEPLAD